MRKSVFCKTTKKYISHVYIHMTCVCIGMHIHIYIYTHTYAYIFLYTYIIFICTHIYLYKITPIWRKRSDIVTIDYLWEGKRLGSKLLWEEQKEHKNKQLLCNLIYSNIRENLKIIIHVNYSIPTDVNLMFNVDIVARNHRKEDPVLVIYSWENSARFFFLIKSLLWPMISTESHKQLKCFSVVLEIWISLLKDSMSYAHFPETEQEWPTSQSTLAPWSVSPKLLRGLKYKFYLITPSLTKIFRS